MVYFLHIKELSGEYAINIARSDFFVVILPITRVRKCMYFPSRSVPDA